jgi:hypothetical protein
MNPQNCLTQHVCSGENFELRETSIELNGEAIGNNHLLKKTVCRKTIASWW